MFHALSRIVRHNIIFCNFWANKRCADERALSVRERPLPTPPPSSATTLCVQTIDPCWQNEAENETIPGTQTDPHLNNGRLEKEHTEALSFGVFPLPKMKGNKNQKTDVEAISPSQPRKVTAGSLQDISKPWGHVYCWNWLLGFVSFLFLYRQRNRGNKLEFSPELCRKNH